MENKDITLYYWKIRGLGCPVASLLEYLNVPYNYVQYVAGEGKWRPAKEKLIEDGFLNPNLPYINDKSADLNLSETFAVLYYLADKYNNELAPKTSKEITNFLMVKGMITDYNSGITITTYVCQTQDELKEKLVGKMKYNIAKTIYFRETLKKQNWVTGDKLSVLDFYLSELLEKLICMQDELKTDFVDEDTLNVYKAYVARFNALEAIKKYRDSDRFVARPFNNTIRACWG